MSVQFEMKTLGVATRLKPVALVCCVCWSAHGAVGAQTAELDAMVVTATRTAMPVSDVLADVSIIDRAQLERSGMQSLVDVLAHVAGLQISTSGSYRSSTGMFLRGATSSQTILLINGVRVGSATSGSYALESIPLDRIERVEVLRGAAAALYGSDAVGGVIQVFTREPQEGVQRSVSMGVGSDGQRQLGANLQGQSGPWGYSLGASHEKARGINVKLPGASGFNADEDGFEYSSLDASLKYRINRQHEISGQFLLSAGEYDFDSAPSPNPLSLNASTSRAVALPKMEQQVFKWSSQWTEGWSSVVTMGRSKDDSVSRYWRLTDGASAGESRHKTTRTQFVWQNDIVFGRDALSLVAEHRKDAVDSTTAYTASQRTTRGALASYAIRRDIWDLLAMARHEHNSQFGAFNTWALSGGYKLSSDFRLVGSTGTTFLAPTFNQLYWPCANPCTSSSYRGDPGLTPQRGRAHEVGMRYQRGSTRASAIFYRNEVRGFISPATNVQSSLAILKGVTLSLDQRWGATALSFSYDHADPRLKPSDERVTRVARNVLRARLGHQLGVWSPFFEVRLSSNREDTQWPGRITLPGYSLLNVGTSYKLSSQWSLQARLNNLTNKSYSLANGYTMPGRNLFVSLSWND